MNIALKSHTGCSITANAACTAQLTPALWRQVLPNSLSSLPRLSMLLLAGCPRLRSLPPNFAALSALEWLDLFGCESLQALPQQVSKSFKPKVGVRASTCLVLPVRLGLYFWIPQLPWPSRSQQIPYPANFSGLHRQRPFRAVQQHAICVDADVGTSSLLSNTDPR